MRSTCPSCLSQIEHSNSDTQVSCSFCGETYSPFLAATDKQSLSESKDTSDFSESALAFKEIVDFGQNLDKSTPTPKAAEPQPAPRTLDAPSEMPTDIILTTTDLGHEYRITHWYLPVTKMISLEEDRSPLEKCFLGLKETAKELGATAIIGIRCSLAPDNKRALVMGTPVQCRKNL